MRAAVTERRGGGASVSHENRRDELETFARHLGFHLCVCLPPGLIPDVALGHETYNAVFLGDAKHTERPDDRATRARLLRYLCWLASCPCDTEHVFAVAHGPSRDGAWPETIVELGEEAGLRLHQPWVRRLSAGTTVAVVRVSCVMNRPSVDSGT